MRYRSRLHIDLNLLAENILELRSFASSKILFMVKADGYGHGAVPLVRFTYEELGITEFGCATLGEAMQLREELPDLKFEVYVFSDVQLEDEELAEVYLHHRIIPVLSSFDSLNIFLKNPDFRHFPLCLKFNTGMNRLGLDSQKLDQVIELLKKSGRMSLYHIMTHFSCGSLPMKKNKRNLYQISEFKRIKEELALAGFEIERTSISNSGAIEQKVGLDETHIRPGLMLYGPSSLLPQYRELSCWKGKIISSLETYIIDVFKAERGMPIGYGASTCPDNGLVAIIALGHGDGLFTGFKGVELCHKKKHCKVFGRVNMDMTQVFFKGANSDQAVAGEAFVIWDHDAKKFEKICEQTKLIPYELFCQLTSRVPRVYSLSE